MKIRQYVYFTLAVLIIISVAGCLSQNEHKTSVTPEETVKINHNEKVNTGKVSDQIRFVTVGDLHVKVSNTTPTRGNERLEKIVEFINNKSDIDFVVFLGDLGDTGSEGDYKIVKPILNNLNKPYYTIAGNHDLKYCIPHSDGSLSKGCAENQAVMYEKYFGPQTHLEHFKGYQFLFVGIKSYYRKENKEYIADHFDWIFDFNRPDLDKTMPTLVFLHGVERPAPPYLKCANWLPGFTEYGVTMLPYLENFSNLIAVYSGHVHLDTYQEFDTGESRDVKFITNGALVNTPGAGSEKCPESATNFIGYSIINDSKLNYSLIPYTR